MASGYGCQKVDNCIFQDPITATSTTVQNLLVDFCSNYATDRNTVNFTATINGEPLSNPTLQNNVLWTVIDQSLDTIGVLVQWSFDQQDGYVGITYAVQVIKNKGAASQSILVAYNSYVPGCFLCSNTNGGCWQSKTNATEATCADLGLGSVECSCPSNYDGDETNCQAIDNCLKPDKGGCDLTHGICTMTGPAANSCSCVANYTLSEDKTCSPINPCLSADKGGCSTDHGYCTYVGPNDSTCHCDSGYELMPNNACSALNYCEIPSQNDCGKDATCHFTGGGTFDCICNANYTGDGKTCFPVNMCTSSPNVCGQNAVCQYAGPGLYHCESMGSGGSGGLGTTWIIVIVVVACGFFAALTAGLVFCCRRYRKRKEADKALRGLPTLSAKRKPINESAVTLPASVSSQSAGDEVFMVDSSEVGKSSEKKISLATSMAYDIPYDTPQHVDGSITDVSMIQDVSRLRAMVNKTGMEGYPASETTAEYPFSAPTPAPSRRASGATVNTSASWYSNQNIYTAKMGIIPSKSMSSRNAEPQSSSMSCKSEFFSDISSNFDEAEQDYLYPDISNLQP